MAQNLADIQVRGTGAASGNSIIIVARPLGDNRPAISVAPGTVLVNGSASQQDMVVRRLLGWRVDERQYRPADAITLWGPANAQTYAVEAYCLNFHRDNPDTAASFTLGGTAAPAITDIFDALDRVPGASDDPMAIQAAIWAATDNATQLEVAERGYPADQARVRAVLHEAGLDEACTSFFGQPCSGTPQASGQETQAFTVTPTLGAQATTTVLDAQAKTFFAPSPDAIAIAVAGDAIWLADGAQRRIYRVDRNGMPLGSFHVDGQGEFRGLAWDGEALRLLVRDPQTGAQVLRLDTQGNVLSRFTLHADLYQLAWDPVDRVLWTIASQSDGFLLMLGADGDLRQTLQVPVFGSVEGLAWAQDGLWVLSGFGKWYRFGAGGEYRAAADLPMEVFAKHPALTWDERGYLWVSVADTRAIYQFGVRQATVDAELPPELRSSAEDSVKGQLPWPRPALRALPHNTNAVIHVANGLPAPLSLALDSVSGETLHESAMVAPGETWTGTVASGGTFTLFASANGAEPVAFSGKVLLLAGYEYTWPLGDSAAVSPTLSVGAERSTALPIAEPTASPLAEAPTAVPTATRATVRTAPTAAPTVGAIVTAEPTATPQPPSAPAADCPDPRVRITYPAAGAIISGVTNFIGSANLPNQAYYKFEYKPADSPIWQYLTRVDGKVVSNDKLMDFFTTSVPPVAYDFRLMAVDRAGNYPEPCVIRVSVQR
jgi:hypothetical protein